MTIPAVASDLRYPIGEFSYSGSLSAAQRQELIEIIASLPTHMRSAVSELSQEQLDTPYRDGGWTVRQVVHHVADSHMNSFTRFRLALTEDEPTIKPYDEKLWAEIADSRTAPVEMSLNLLFALHQRWVLMLKSLKPDQWNRKFKHPEAGMMDLNKALASYAWHSRHHVAHIVGLRRRNEW